MLDVNNLVKFYGKKCALDHLTFHIQRGEIVGFLGPNGAGKSTTMNIITTYLTASSGTVKVNGHDVLEEPEKAKRAIGYLPEQPPLYPDMTVNEYLRFVGKLKGLKFKRLHDDIERVKKVVKIDAVSKRLIRNLSKGYKQRVGIAQALLGNPEVLILDEPTVGLDPNQIVEIRALIRELGQNHTIILSSHILSEVQAVCDRVLILGQGRLILDAPLKHIEKKLQDHAGFLLKINAPEKPLIESLRRIPEVGELDLLSTEQGICQVQVQRKVGQDPRPAIFTKCAQERWTIYEMKSLAPSLEELFMRLTTDNDLSKELAQLGLRPEDLRINAPQDASKKRASKYPIQAEAPLAQSEPKLRGEKS